MAVVTFQGSFTLQDELGTKATLPFFLQGPDTSTLADLQTALNAIATVLDPITGAHILSARANVMLGLPGGIKVAPAAGSRVEQTGLFNWTNAATPFKYGIDVPAIKDSTIVAGKINLADAAIEAFTDVFEGAIGVFTAVTGGYDPLVALIDAALTFRKHRKQLSRSSAEVGST